MPLSDEDIKVCAEEVLANRTRSHVRAASELAAWALERLKNADPWPLCVFGMCGQPPAPDSMHCPEHASREGRLAKNVRTRCTKNTTGPSRLPSGGITSGQCEQDEGHPPPCGWVLGARFGQAPKAEADDGFGCCGGNDTEPRHHTADCPVYPWTGAPPAVTPRYRPASATPDECDCATYAGTYSPLCAEHKHLRTTSATHTCSAEAGAQSYMKCLACQAQGGPAPSDHREPPALNGPRSDE